MAGQPVKDRDHGTADGASIWSVDANGAGGAVASLPCVVCTRLLAGKSRSTADGGACAAWGRGDGPAQPLGWLETMAPSRRDLHTTD